MADVEFIDNSEQVLNALKGATEAAARIIGGQIRNYARQGLDGAKGPKGGRWPTEEITALKQSIAVEVEDESTGPVLSVGSQMEIAPYIELGIRIQKRWMATLDDKTRDAHADLDGQIAEIDEPFDSLLGPIDYPGDPDAEPANVYNCRCGMDEVFPGYSATMYRTDSDGNVVGNVTYREWQRSKMGEG